jgi:Amidase
VGLAEELLAVRTSVTELVRELLERLDRLAPVIGAVAGASPLALGSDSGGSIRLPAAWCGVAGLKPTFGRVPLTGHFPRCGSLEDGRTVIGPLAPSVDDLAAVLAVIAGPDGRTPGRSPCRWAIRTGSRCRRCAWASSGTAVVTSRRRGR